MKTTITRYVTWLYKEWRDQRAIILGILIAIPGLTALAYVGFGEHLGGARLEMVGLTFLAIAVGLVVFAIAGDLFAGENRRGTIHALRRLPGGLGSSFLAKLTVLTVVILAVVALQGLSLAVAEHLNAGRLAGVGISDYHRNGATRAMTVWDQLRSFPTSPLWLAGLGMGVLGLWTLLVSSWMGRSGVASIGAIVLLGALATPFAWLFKEHPWFFPGPLRLAASIATVAALVALAALALSFLRGQRYAGRPFRPFLLGFGVLLVALGGGYAYAQQSLDDWVSFGPGVEDFRIHHAHMGADGRYLYINVARGTLWDNERPVSHHRHDSDPWAFQRGTPSQAWVVDLHAGAWRALDDRKVRYFLEVPECQGVYGMQALDPVEALVCYDLDDPEQPGLQWWDARAAEGGRTTAFGVRDARSLALVRRQLAADTWLRNAWGKRVWLRDETIEREDSVVSLGDGLLARDLRNRSLGMLRPVPGGWFGYDMKNGGAYVILDALTGVQTRVHKLPRTSGYWHSGVLSTTHMLIRETLQPALDARGGPITRVRVMAFADPEAHVAAKNEPARIGTVLAEDLVFAERGPETARTLHLWNPRTGADREIPWTGAALQDIRQASVLGRTGDGRAWIHLRTGKAGASRFAAAVLDAKLEGLRVVRPWTRDNDVVIALMPDDSVVVLRAGRSVVRIQPGGRETTLFPKP